jgi:hypothetical protein
LIWSNRMLKPCAKNSASPPLRLGAIACSYTSRCSVSGSSIITRSASAAAWSIDTTGRPAVSAFSFDDEPSRRPTRTSTPESFRLRACAWPCDPYPTIATLRLATSEESASFS